MEGIIMENQNAAKCEGFFCMYEGTDECTGNCKECGHNNCKSCESSKKGTC